jgi:hypothetical protein
MDMTNFLKKLFRWKPRDRPTAAKMLKHSWLCKDYKEDDEKEKFRAGDIVNRRVQKVKDI